jgi:antitoxin HigA-1
MDFRLSGDIALRIEKSFGVKVDSLMQMQSAYDIAHTRKREKRSRSLSVMRADAGAESSA